MLREELQLLQEPGSYVGEVVKVMGKNKVLVKVSSFTFFTNIKLILCTLVLITDHALIMLTKFLDAFFHLLHVFSISRFIQKGNMSLILIKTLMSQRSHHQQELLSAMTAMFFI